MLSLMPAQDGAVLWTEYYYLEDLTSRRVVPSCMRVV
jgi:hypothetical protein